MAVTDPQRACVQDDLRGLIAGEVRCDEVFAQMYAGDGSIYEIRPLGVVRPRSIADVITCLQYAAEHEISIHPRGAGTGVAGESLGPGLVLDFSAHLGRILASDQHGARVQPGAVLERLNTQLARRGRTFPPDPDNAAVGTVGGAVARDARGGRYRRYGSVRDYVRGMKIVLADGTRMEVGSESVSLHRQRAHSSAKSRLVTQVADILRDNDRLIAEHQRRPGVNRCGYQLGDVLEGDTLHLSRLLVGSEGTLAIFTEVTLETAPLPGASGVAVLCFESLEQALHAVRELAAFEPTVCDLADRRHLSLARQSDAQLERLIPEETEAAVLIEAEGSDPPEARRRVLAMVDHVHETKGLAFASRQAFECYETDVLRRLSRLNQPALFRSKGRARAVPVFNDMAVPPERLPEFLVAVQNALRKHQVTASLYCHAGHGEVHLLPFFDLSSEDEKTRMRHLADDLYAAVLERGGSLSGELACGISRTPFVVWQYGPLADVFRLIKRTFDPGWLLNPGKVVGDADDSWLQNLRATVDGEAPRPSTAHDSGEVPAKRSARRRSQKLQDILQLQLNWDPSQVANIAQQCTGCGECRTCSPQLRMCPIFRVHPCEEATPRSKANLIRGVLTGQLPLEALSSEEFKAIADQCVHCHMCVLECPANVDIPKLMAEGKGAYVAAHGPSLPDWILARLDLVGKLGSTMSPLANWTLTNRAARWTIEKVFGIAHGRKLARFTRHSFVSRAARRNLTRPTRRSGLKVAYFVDVFANYYDPELAEAFVAVLEHNGISVFVPPDQRQAGMAAIATGVLDLAGKLARHNATIFAEAVRQGYHVVTTEPAAAVCLTREYPSLFDDADVRLVADNASEASQFLWSLHLAGGLQLDFKPINAVLGYHMPCRMKALGVGSPSESLLRLIPGLTVKTLEAGCSGMAGTFGIKRQNYRTSLRAGWTLIDRLRHPSLQAGTTECSTCKMQMEQGTTKPTIHPIKLLAAAYGLLPGGLNRLFRPGEELVVT